MNCPHCGAALSERGSFCKVCAGQARCMSCREVLEPGAAACVECGTKVGVRPDNGGITSIPAAAPAIASNRNTLTYHEDKNSRSFEASLTDPAMQGLGDVLGDFFIQRGAVRGAQQQGRFNKVEVFAPAALTNGVDIPPVPPADATDIIPPTSPVAIIGDEQAAEKARLLKIFAVKGNTFELIDNRVKATNLSDYVRRLTYLFLYANESHGRSSMKEEDVVNLLKASKAWDKSGNSRRWLTRRVLIKDEGDDAIKLTGPGREEAIKILNQALDPAVEDKWNPDFNKPKPRGVRKKKKA